jgi:hypothetical protein
VHPGATLILENIIIDGDKSGAFVDGEGSLIWVSQGGALVMNDGAFVQNNNFSNGSGGGVQNSGNFTMIGGKISGNNSYFGGGLSVVAIEYATCIMIGGEISDNNSTGFGGGVFVYNCIFTMNGGKISGNTSGLGSGVRVDNNSIFYMNGGIIEGIGTSVGDVVNSSFNLNTSAPANGIIIAWNKPDGVGPFNYTEGRSDDLDHVPSNATAVWASEGGKFGVLYANGINVGFIEIADVVVTKGSELNPAVINIMVTPTVVSVQKGMTQQFTANVTTQDGASTAITWSISGHALTATNISPSGLLTVANGETANTLTITATSDFDRTKYGVATVTVTEPVDNEEIHDGLFAVVYPNPTDGKIYLQLETEVESIVSIINITGNILFIQTVNDPITQLDLSNYPAGMYFIRIVKDGIAKTIKAIRK